MENEINTNSQWTLITIVDPECLPGKSILNMIELLLTCINFKFTIVDALYGAGISNLEKMENQILFTKDLLEMLPEVKQFDWGDFFLFKEEPIEWKNSKKEPYHNIIIQTDTTVRAVDDGYIYVYTKYKSIIDLIKNNYEIEGLKCDSLDNLDFPE